MSFWIGVIGIAATLTLVAIICIAALDAWFALRCMTQWNSGRAYHSMVLTACVLTLLGMFGIVFVAVAR